MNTWKHSLSFENYCIVAHWKHLVKFSRFSLCNIILLELVLEQIIRDDVFQTKNTTFFKKMKLEVYEFIWAPDTRDLQTWKHSLSFPNYCIVAHWKHLYKFSRFSLCNIIILDLILEQLIRDDVFQAQNSSFLKKMNQEVCEFILSAWYSGFANLKAFAFVWELVHCCALKTSLQIFAFFTL